jgi:phosphopantothenoylcysteine synthetase/decarboxylase
MTDQILLLEQELVLAQLSEASPRLKFFVGGANGTEMYTRKQLLEHVEALDEIGKEFIRTQIEFLQSFKEGELTEVLSKEG